MSEGRGRTTLAIDIGGTFVDVAVRAPDGRIMTGKYLAGADPLDAVVGGVEDLLARSCVEPGALRRVLHATTLATNAILQDRGAPVAFVTTRGFGDLLALGRDTPVDETRYDLWRPAPAPLVPRALCFEVDERVTAGGAVGRALSDEAAASVAEALGATGVEAVAVCLLHAYANPAHERLLAAAIRAAMPSAHVVCSSDVWPEPREFERATTTVVSATVGPVMAGYLRELAARLAGLGVTAPIHVLDSSGGLMTPARAAEHAATTVESGPAAGVLTARAVAVGAGHPDAVAFDMGGTTAKAGLVRGGSPTLVRDFRVGGVASSGGRRAGSGVPVKVPTMDLAEVGAGGGSVAWVDETGGLRVGPRSQGADPGPACYGRGGEVATVTDADLVLGYLGDRPLAGGSLALDRAAAERALDRLARRLGIGRTEAAAAVHDVANVTMAFAIHVVTVQRGVDPRRFVLVATGGAGPVHAARVAERFEVGTVVVPEHSGAASATGLLDAATAAERVATLRRPVALPAPGRGGDDPGPIEELAEELAGALAAELSLDIRGARVERSVLARYRGQAHELSVAVPAGAVDAAAASVLAHAFEVRYRERYGTVPGGPAEVVGVVVRVGEGAGPPVAHPGPQAAAGGEVEPPAADHRRPAFFVEAGGFVEVEVWRRAACAPGTRVRGPAIVEEPGSTSVVPPGWSAEIDGGRRLLLVRAAGGVCQTPAVNVP